MNGTRLGTSKRGKEKGGQSVVDGAKGVYTRMKIRAVSERKMYLKGRVRTGRFTRKVKRTRRNIYKKRRKRRCVGKSVGIYMQLRIANKTNVGFRCAKSWVDGSVNEGWNERVCEVNLYKV